VLSSSAGLTIHVHSMPLPVVQATGVTLECPQSVSGQTPDYIAATVASNEEV
jgi:hypothetical protein